MEMQKEVMDLHKTTKKAISKLITIHSTQSGMQLTILLTVDLLFEL